MPERDPRTGRFVNQATKITGDLERLATRIIVKISLDVHANLVAAPQEGGTPIDTGWASSNWIPSVGVPVGDPVGSPEEVSDAAAQSGVVDVLGYRLGRGTVFIANPVPYIVRLNDGSSKQAPAGFVQAAIRKALEVDLGGIAA